MSFGSRDYRYFASRSRSRAYRPLAGEALREMRRKDVEKLALQVGDKVRYDFGGQRQLTLEVTAIDEFWIRTVDDQGRVFRFGGLEAFAPGVWEGNRIGVSAIIHRAES